MGEIPKNGQQISCSRCGGSGQIWQPAEGWSDECARCCGSGVNWQYPRGAIAKYYSGPLIGKDTHPSSPDHKNTELRNEA